MQSYGRTAGGGKHEGIPYVYDPKFDVTITFLKDITRPDVIAWLLKNGIHKHMLTGVLMKKKSEWEIQLTSRKNALNT